MKKFVVFEGIDGSGKSTVSRRVYEELEMRGYDAILTHEPFNEEIKRLIEEIMEKGGDPFSVTLLFLVDRIEHSKRIKEWLDQGKIVVCDRYEDSTYAYQSVQLNGLIEDPVKYLKSIISDRIVHPDRVYILDIDPEIALSRIGRDRRPRGFEEREFLAKVRKNYIKLAKGERYRIIDGRKRIDDIVDECLKDILGE